MISQERQFDNDSFAIISNNEKEHSRHNISLNDEQIFLEQKKEIERIKLNNQKIQNEKENEKNLQKTQFYLLLTDYQFFELRECLSCFNFNIGNTLTDFFNSLKINKDISYMNYFGTSKKKSNLNLSQVKNPLLKQMIEFRMYEKEFLNTMEKREKGKYKPLPSYLLVLQKIIYLYFHCFLLIIMIMLSLMTAGILSAGYFAMCFYYLIKSDSIFLGQEYTYPKAIKTTLRIIVLVDIIIQGIYQFPIFSFDEVNNNWLKAFGLTKVFDINDFDIYNSTNTNNNNNNTKVKQLEIFGKALIYFLMSTQNLIYNSKTFKRYYLVYLLENRFQTNKTSLINAFTFNNHRVKIYEKSLAIRQKSVEIMDDLKKLINELNSDSNKMGEKLYSKNIFQVKKRSPLEFIKEKENLKNNNNEIQNISKVYLEVDEIKDKIKSMLYDKFVTKIYLWLHNHTANYKNIDKEALNDFYIETIKGETKIKSIIENDINTCLSIIDLTGLY